MTHLPNSDGLVLLAGGPEDGRRIQHPEHPTVLLELSWTPMLARYYEAKPGVYRFHGSFTATTPSLSARRARRRRAMADLPNERWTVMSRTPSEGGYGWLTIIAGPQVGEDGETFEVMRAEVTDEMRERAIEAVQREARARGVRLHEDVTRYFALLALEAALSTQQKDGGS